MAVTFNDIAIAAGRVKPGWQGARRVITGARRYPVLPIAVLLIVMLIPALFAEQITTHNPEIGSLRQRLQPPAWQEGGSWSYPLGTDKLGRDILTRMIYGSRISLVVCLSAIFLSGLIGSAMGITAGYFRGNLDHVISRLVDISMALPAILVALVLVVVSEGSFFVKGDAVVIVTVLILWSRYARQMRGETYAIMSQDYISRARVAGCSPFRIMIFHIFPNVLNTLVVLATLQIGFVIILEASLSFLGAGIPRPAPAWGSMVADGRELITSAWWISFFPGLGIVLTVVSMNLLGDWLRDKLDPKLRQI